MKYYILAAIATVSLLTAPAMAQGVLSAPGAPAPTMKTLAQIEPRSPLGTPGQTATSKITIAEAGSYVLMSPITVTAGDAITITAGNVTLDLNGFTLTSTASGVNSSSGISVTTGLSNITLRNGFICGQTTYNGSTFAGGGFGYGILLNDSVTNAVVENISISGVSLAGTCFNSANSKLVVRNCCIRISAFDGFEASSVIDSIAETCGNNGISAFLSSNCRGDGNQSGISGVIAQNCIGTGKVYGITVATATNCYGQGGTGTGLSATTASNCKGISTAGTGLYASGAADNCTGTSTSGTGLSTAGSANNCRGISDSESGNHFGLRADDSATNCYGSIAMGIALSTSGTASFCRGNHTAGGPAIHAAIAVACTAVNGTITATISKQLGTP